MSANETVVEQDIQNPAIEENEDVHSEFDDAWNEAEEDAGLRDSETAKLRDTDHWSLITKSLLTERALS